MPSLVFGTLGWFIQFIHEWEDTTVIQGQLVSGDEKQKRITQETDIIHVNKRNLSYNDFIQLQIGYTVKRLH